MADADKAHRQAAHLDELLASARRALDWWKLSDSQRVLPIQAIPKPGVTSTAQMADHPPWSGVDTQPMRIIPNGGDR